MGEICPRSDPYIAHMRCYLGPLKLKYKYLFSQCTTGYTIWDNFNFPMLNPHWQLCKYGPHLWLAASRTSQRLLRFEPWGDLIGSWDCLDMSQYVAVVQCIHYSCIGTFEFQAMQSKGRTINDLGGLGQRIRVEFFFLANRLMRFFPWPTGWVAVKFLFSGFCPGPPPNH